MSMADEVNIMISGVGELRCTAGQMDRALMRHPPASPNELRQKIDSHPNNGFGPGHYDRLDTVTEYLMVLADLDERQG